MSAELFADRALEALAQGASGSEIRALATKSDSHLLEFALQIRANADEQVERERALSQLVDSVRELAGLDALEGVLRSIVSRSRRLMMSDVAYFLTFDEHTATARMHVSEGIISDAFARLVIPPEEGISGFIATSRKPSWTADYLAEPRYRHNNVIDTATTEEGLRAILGVPVLRSGRVVGILLAADRHAHSFSSQDVELLFSLAQHAGVVIENATVHEHEQQNVERLQDSVQALQASESATRNILAFQDRLLALMMNEGSLNDLVELTQTTLGGTALVVDERGRILARAGDDDSPVSTESGWALEPLGTSPTEIGFIGHLNSKGNASIDQRQVLSRSATVARLLMTRLRADLSSSRDRSAKLVTELVKDPGGSIAAMLAASSPVDVDSLATALIASCESSSDYTQLLGAAHDFAEARGGLACEFDEAVLLWLPDIHARTCAEVAARALSSSSGGAVTVGAAPLLGGRTGLSAATDEARAVQRALSALGRVGAGAVATDVAPFPSILANNSPAELRAFVDNVLGVFLDYDTQHGTALATTLESVYSLSNNVTLAADALFVHPNTVHQRLARIDEISGESWRETAVSMRRQLAFTVLNLIAAQPELTTYSDTDHKRTAT
ncbi:GAF domain-containing protein [Rhodococcus fascians]|nr:GAF domain-containing protein [Rhodococcus fascians]